MEQGGEAELIVRMKSSVQTLGSSAQNYENTTLRRFLVARSMDPEKAAKMLVQWQKWRAGIAPLGFIPDSEVPDELDARKVYLGGPTKDGHPLLTIKLSKHYPSKDQLQFKMKEITALLHDISATVQTHSTMLTGIQETLQQILRRLGPDPPNLPSAPRQENAFQPPHQTLGEREDSIIARDQKIHCGSVKDPPGVPSTGVPILLNEGQEFNFTITRSGSTQDTVTIHYDDFVNDVEAGERLHLYAVSFVKDAKVVHELKSYLKGCGADIHVSVKIESADSIPNLESIVSASDGAMVARGDLGVLMDVSSFAIDNG